MVFKIAALETYSHNPMRATARKLLSHAKEHRAKGEPFDLLIANISADNGLELFLKDFAILHKIHGAREMQVPVLIDCLQYKIPELRDPRMCANLKLVHYNRDFSYHTGNSPDLANLGWSIDLIERFMQDVEKNEHTRMVVRK
jgi:hypothetical protein